MTQTALKSGADAPAPGSTRAFLDKLQREIGAIQAGERSSQLIRSVTDDHPAWTTVWGIAVASAVSCAAGWAIVHFHLG